MQIPEIKVAGGVDDKKPYLYCLNVPVKTERPAEENSKILIRGRRRITGKAGTCKILECTAEKVKRLEC